MPYHATCAHAVDLIIILKKHAHQYSWFHHWHQTLLLLFFYSTVDLAHLKRQSETYRKDTNTANQTVCSFWAEERSHDSHMTHDSSVLGRCEKRREFEPPNSNQQQKSFILIRDYWSVDPQLSSNVTLIRKTETRNMDPYTQVSWVLVHRTARFKTNWVRPVQNESKQKRFAKLFSQRFPRSLAKDFKHVYLFWLCCWVMKSRRHFISLTHITFWNLFVTWDEVAARFEPKGVVLQVTSYKAVCSLEGILRRTNLILWAWKKHRNRIHLLRSWQCHLFMSCRNGMKKTFLPAIFRFSLINNCFDYNFPCLLSIFC